MTHPFAVNWDTSWVPDQQKPIQLAARIVDDTNLIYMTPAVGELQFRRPGLSVEFCKPEDVPDNWVTRNDEYQQSITIKGDLNSITAARLCWSSWSPGYMNGLFVNGQKVMDAEGPKYRYFDHRVAIDDLSLLEQGKNTVSTGKTPLHDGNMVHGMEVNWPGIQLLIQRNTANAADSENAEVGMRTLSSDEVARVLDDDDWVLVDTRETDAYNGWKLDDVQRGGHLPGAVDFPVSWLDSKREDKTEVLAAALQSKGIEPDRNVLLYGTQPGTRTRVASFLREAGFRALYDFDVTTWADDQTRPLEKHKNFQLLVPASIVKRLLDGERPETFEHSKRIKFAEVSWGGEDASYLKGHVPRSFHINTDDFEPPPKWTLGDPVVLRQFAAKYGLQLDDTVILSGDDPTASYRAAIVLRYMGVKDVRVLNGGFGAWQAANYPIETKATLPPKAASFGATIPGRPDLIDQIDQVRVGLKTPQEFTLVDTRTWDEFTGKTSGYKTHKHKGRIPNSVYGQSDFKGTDSLTPYRNIDNTMRNPNEILALWKQSGIDTEQHLSFMCGGGWRAAEVLTYAQVMGLSKTSLYSDGWIGWSNDPTNPILKADKAKRN